MSRSLGAAARGAHAGGKAEVESKAQVSLGKAGLRPLGVWELAQGEGELRVALSAADRMGFVRVPQRGDCSSSCAPRRALLRAA